MSDLPNPISNNDLYLAFLNGIGSIENLPKPISRSDMYLYNLCMNAANAPTRGKKYGVRQYKNSSDPTLERVGDSVGLVVNAGVGESIVRNDFDYIYPWNGRKRCNLSSDGKVLAYQGEPGFKLDGSNGNVMVETPVFYQKYVETEEYKEWWIADYPAPGFRLSPRFVTKSGKILEKIYVGAYEASFDGTNLQSISGQAISVNTGRQTQRARAKAIGEGWGLEDIAFRCDILFYLFTVEFATLNSQAIMNGIVSDSAAHATGETDSVVASSGSSTSNTSGKSAFVYRGMENIWGNVWEWIDGCNIKDYQAYVCSNPEDYTDDKFIEPYIAVGYKNSQTYDSFIKEMGYDEEIPYCNLPIEVGGSSNTYYCDKYYCSAGNKAPLVGGGWAHGSSAGLSDWYCYIGFGASASSIGARLSYKPS